MRRSTFALCTETLREDTQVFLQDRHGIMATGPTNMPAGFKLREPTFAVGQRVVAELLGLGELTGQRWNDGRSGAITRDR